MRRTWIGVVSIAIGLLGCNLFKGAKSSSQNAATSKSAGFALVGPSDPMTTPGAEDTLDPSCDCAACAAIPRPTGTPDIIAIEPIETSVPTDPSEWDAAMSLTVDMDKECICPGLDGETVVPSPTAEPQPSSTPAMDDPIPSPTSTTGDMNPSPTPAVD